MKRRDNVVIKQSASTTGGIGCISLLAVLLTVLFVGLKLTNFINWSWFWVLSPLWITILLAFGIFVLVVIAVIVYIGIRVAKNI